MSSTLSYVRYSSIRYEYTPSTFCDVSGQIAEKAFACCPAIKAPVDCAALKRNDGRHRVQAKIGLILLVRRPDAHRVGAPKEQIMSLFTHIFVGSRSTYSLDDCHSVSMDTFLVQTKRGKRAGGQEDRNGADTKLARRHHCESHHDAPKSTRSTGDKLLREHT